MGNFETKPETKTVVKHETKIENVKDFGSYNDPENPRPGYYKVKSKRQVFYRGKLMPKADFETFKKMGQGYAQDKNNRYYRGERVKN